MTTAELDAIKVTDEVLDLMEKRCQLGYGGLSSKQAAELIVEVRRLRVEVDEVHDDRLRVMAERDALRAANATLARAVNGQPLPPGHVAVPRELLLELEARLPVLCDERHDPKECTVAKLRIRVRALLEGKR